MRLVYRLKCTLMSVLIILALPTSSSSLEILQPSFPKTPPHCTNLIKSSEFNDDLDNTTHIFLRFELDHTACFRLDNTTNGTHSLFNDVLDQRSQDQGWLHTLTFSALEHHHPISQRYEFAIPEVKITCICECGTNSDICSARTYYFTHCSYRSSRESLHENCFRTFHPDKGNAGCQFGSQPNTCCELSFIPYQNKSFMAVKLEPPQTFVTFEYVAYAYTANQWIEKDKRTITTKLYDQLPWHFLNRWQRFQMGVLSGGLTKQLKSGMYFLAIKPDGEMDGLRHDEMINEIDENNFKKLGWFRKDSSGHFIIFDGETKIQRLHSLKVENCKEQKSMSFLSARYFVNHNDPKNLENLVSKATMEQIYPWIRSAKVDGKFRHRAVVTFSESSIVDIALKFDGKYNLLFMHHSSDVDDFSGIIKTGLKSNLFLNLTVYNATGTIYGTVKKSTNMSNNDEFTFAIYNGQKRNTRKNVIVSLPSSFGGQDRMICLRADGDFNKQICRIIAFNEVALETNLLENTWIKNNGHCPECNKITSQDFFSKIFKLG